MNRRDRRRESWLIIALICVIFISGAMFSSAYLNFVGRNGQIPNSNTIIRENEVYVHEDKVVIYVNSSVKYCYRGDSMLPTLNSNMQGIVAPVNNPSELSIGNVISYKDRVGDSVTHRIIDIGIDKEGWWCRAKGDNNPIKDPGKIRFEQIKGITIALIY